MLASNKKALQTPQNPTAPAHQKLPFPLLVERDTQSGTIEKKAVVGEVLKKRSLTYCTTDTANPKKQKVYFFLNGKKKKIEKKIDTLFFAVG